jgi:alpha-beta hydrolase superfamily lysophospholipase
MEYELYHNGRMVRMSLWVSVDDKTKLFVRRWKTEAAPLGMVHLVHGMSEHSGRYDRFAEALTAKGFEVWAADQRGHGKTADAAVNSIDAGGLLGHTADEDGFFRVVEDIGFLTRYIAESCTKEYGKAKPLFIMGHSWGSFLVQGYIETLGRKNPPPVSGCILSGTRGPGGFSLMLSSYFLSLVAALCGSRHGSKFVHSLADGSYSKPFKPNRTPSDWLSRDEKEVDAFIEDPLCAHLCSTGFYRDMIKGLRAIHRIEAINGIPNELPVYIFCGSADPVGGMGAGPTKLVNAYRAAGLTGLEFVVYPDARHELLNETNREEVTEALLSWLLRHC